MTASEARRISDGSKDHKSLWFKLRLIWICGRINKFIEKQAEIGGHYVFIHLSTPLYRNKYYPLLKKMYEEMGYVVCQVGGLDTTSTFEISWLKPNEEDN